MTTQYNKCNCGAKKQASFAKCFNCNAKAKGTVVIIKYDTCGCGVQKNSSFKSCYNCINKICKCGKGVYMELKCFSCYENSERDKANIIKKANEGEKIKCFLEETADKYKHLFKKSFIYFDGEERLDLSDRRICEKYVFSDILLKVSDRFKINYQHRSISLEECKKIAEQKHIELLTINRFMKGNKDVIGIINKFLGSSIMFS